MCKLTLLRAQKQPNGATMVLVVNLNVGKWTVPLMTTRGLKWVSFYWQSRMSNSTAEIYLQSGPKKGFGLHSQILHHVSYDGGQPARGQGQRWLTGTGISWLQVAYIRLLSLCLEIGWVGSWQQPQNCKVRTATINYPPKPCWNMEHRA